MVLNLYLTTMSKFEHVNMLRQYYNHVLELSSFFFSISTLHWIFGVIYLFQWSWDLPRALNVVSFKSCLF